MGIAAKEKAAPDCTPEAALSPSDEAFDDGRKSVADRIVKLAHLKNQQAEIAEFLINHPQAFLRRLGDKCVGCATYLLFRDYYRIDQNRLVAANFCKQHYFCPACASRRASNAVQTYAPKFLELQKQHPDHSLFLLTFTVLNGPNLAERVAHVKSSLQKLRKRKNLRGRYPNTILGDCLGSVQSLEVKRGENSRLWHPHVHLLGLFERDWFSLDDMRTEWKYITGDSSVVNPKLRDPRLPIEFHLRETCKYLAKFGDLSPAERVEVWKTLRGSNLISSSGALRGLTVPETLTEQAISGEPYRETLYRWLWGYYSAERSDLVDA